MNGDFRGVRAVRRHAVLGEAEAIVPLQAHVVAGVLGVLLQAGANGEQAVLIRALVLLIPVGSRDILGHLLPVFYVEVLDVPLQRVIERGVGAAGMGNDQAIVLGQVVENGAGGTNGADGFHILNVAEQGQAAHDIVHVDVRLKHHIRLAQVHMRNILLHIADGAGKQAVGIRLVNDFTVQRIAVDRRLRGFRSGFGSGFFGGLGNRRGGLGRLDLGCLGLSTAAAAQQQRQNQRQCNDSFHSSHPFRFTVIFMVNCRK